MRSVRIVQVLAIVSMLEISSGHARAQEDGNGGPSASCGTFAKASDHMVYIAHVFEKELYESLRAKLEVDRVSSGDHERITDQKICGKIVPTVEEFAGRSLDPAEYAVYRYGAYYALEIASGNPPGTVMKGATTRLYVFKVKGTKFIGAALI